MKRLFASVLIPAILGLSAAAIACVDALRDTRDACFGALQRAQMRVSEAFATLLTGPANFEPTQRHRWPLVRTVVQLLSPVERRRPQVCPRWRMCPSS